VRIRALQHGDNRRGLAIGVQRDDADLVVLALQCEAADLRGAGADRQRCVEPPGQRYGQRGGKRGPRAAGVGRDKERHVEARELAEVACKLVVDRKAQHDEPDGQRCAHRYCDQLVDLPLQHIERRAAAVIPCFLDQTRDLERARDTTRAQRVRDDKIIQADEQRGVRTDAGTVILQCRHERLHVVGGHGLAEPEICRQHLCGLREALGVLFQHATEQPLTGVQLALDLGARVA